MDKKITEKNVEYNVLEWNASAFIEHCKTIIVNSDNHIHKIKLDNGDEVYLVPEEFYLTAKKAIKHKKK